MPTASIPGTAGEFRLWDQTSGEADAMAGEEARVG